MAIYFKYYGAHIWNLLPDDIKNSTTIDNFRLLLKTWEGSKCYCIICNAIE